MAKKSQNISAETSTATTATFNKGLNKDVSDSFIPEGTWYHARNLVNNSDSGDLGVVGNEPSNKLCVDLTYTQIGAIPIIEDYWVIFSTDNSMSEIGLFKEGGCEYYIIARDAQFNFNTANLIIGQSKENFDCTFQVYWADNRNPDRSLNIGDIRLGNYPDVLTNNPWPRVPYECTDTLDGPCIDCEPNIPLVVDIERTRLALLMKIPCITIQKGLNGGQLPNGSYYATIAYSINQQRVTDYFNPSQVQPLFNHENLQSSLDINFSNLDTDNFGEFQLVIVSTINQQTVARIIGYYNTQTNAISLDNINPELETVPINYIPLLSPVYEKSEAIYAVNNYMIRTAPTGRFDFNYQPLANQIETNWIMVEYPPDYYEKGGNETGYMRDEQYCFWIRWVYETGDRSASYHIPGRQAFDWEITSAPINSDNIYDPGNDQVWEVYNTAYATFTGPEVLDPTLPLTQGNVIARGKMGYWESTELYPADKPDVWNASQYSWAGVTNNTDYDLCGLPIRHHKMPGDVLHSNGNALVDQGLNSNYSHIRVLPATTIPLDSPIKPIAIRILGTEFFNIKAPVDNYGNLIPGVVGYEILRSNRQGNRTIIGKGILNNMRTYTSENAGSAIAYPNYNCNYLGDDPSANIAAEAINAARLSGRSFRHLTFHSPDTTFQKPFLNATELKLYGLVGSDKNIRGTFETVPGHPKQKLITGTAFQVALALAIGYASKKIKGEFIRTINSGSGLNIGFNGTAGASTGSTGFDNNLPITTYVGLASGAAQLAESLTGASLALDTALGSLAIADGALAVVPGPAGIGRSQSLQFADSDYESMPDVIKGFIGLPTFAYYWSTSTDSLLDLIYALIPYRDYAYRTLNDVDLSQLRRNNVIIGNTRRRINDAAYIENAFTNLGTLQINNLSRTKCVAIETTANVPTPDNVLEPSIEDTSVQTIGTIMSNNSGAINYGVSWKKPSNGYYRSTGSCYYAGLKVRYKNQYGQIESPKQITTGCVKLLNNGLPLTSEGSVLNNVSQVIVSFPQSTDPQLPVILGGDVYIGQYAEKNTFFYFYDWLYNVPDGTPFDYRLKYMINYPRYWADFSKYDSSEFLQQVSGAITNLFTANFQSALNGFLSIGPEANYNLDSQFGPSSIWTNQLQLRLGVKNAYMYLFQSAVRHFFVESEYNVDQRDFGDRPEQKIYDPYGFKNLTDLFDTEIIREDNYYKYDISLGLSKVYNSFISWGSLQDRAYDPFVAEKCYQYFKNRVIYSLPQNQEDKQDYWRIFLINNYYDFDDRVIAFKSINKNGAIILFQHSNPLLFNAVDNLKTESGTKVTIGDGGLFSQPLQTLTNADPSFQYGSCQDRLSVINTPVGIYWLSASQGKIFTVGDGLTVISDLGLKWWFAKYLKYFLLDQFPQFQLVNNPVAGVGAQTIYNSENGILYFCKKDYRLKSEYLENAEYLDTNRFEITVPNVNRVIVQLGDPLYFEDTSWTVSFDIKTKAWLSFHDWHPEFSMSAIRGFLTTIKDNQGSSIWKHGNFTNSFCNFYGTDYPFEIDYIGRTGQAVNTIRSVEYILESYVYDNDGIDKFQVFDFNFDRAVVYNSEQVSGLLKLNLSPKNNAPLIVNYPQVNFSDIDILYSKEEQRTRFNQFWDITNDRGEFQVGGVLVQQPIWNTDLNGYVRVLNFNNLNYNKSPFQRKKFRHYVNHVFLSRLVSNNVKLIFKVINNKLLNSPR